MNNREKVIKDFETEIMNFTPACTSDELLKEIMETALELLKQDGCRNSAMAIEEVQGVQMVGRRQVRERLCASADIR